VLSSSTSKMRTGFGFAGAPGGCSGASAFLGVA
jgi:hypothetical protein